MQGTLKVYPFTLKQDSAAHDHDETDAALIVVAVPEIQLIALSSATHFTLLTAFARTLSDDMADLRRIRFITCAMTWQRLAQVHVLTCRQVTTRLLDIYITP
jgi:hypothetical protein